ncbi:MAG: hypothetical protein ACFFA0_09245 [Promethearchaeota archaeon]
MVPHNSHYKNLSSVFSKNECDIIRKIVYKKDGHKCSICGIINVCLEAHEEWKYNYHESVQKLDSINALCFWCHQNKHLEHAFIMADDDKLDRETLLSHWSKINSRPLKSSRDYFIKSLTLWKLRNKFNWKIFDNKGEEIHKGIVFENILELVCKKPD